MKIKSDIQIFLINKPVTKK